MAGTENIKVIADWPEAHPARGQRTVDARYICETRSAAKLGQQWAALAGDDRRAIEQATVARWLYSCTPARCDPFCKVRKWAR